MAALWVYCFLLLWQEVKSIQIQKQIHTFLTLKPAAESGVSCEFWWVYDFLEGFFLFDLGFFFGCGVFGWWVFGLGFFVWCGYRNWQWMGHEQFLTHLRKLSSTCTTQGIWTFSLECPLVTEAAEKSNCKVTPYELP